MEAIERVRSPQVIDAKLVSTVYPLNVILFLKRKQI